MERMGFVDSKGPFVFALEAEPYVVHVAPYGHAILFNTDVLVHLDEAGFSVEINPNTPGRIELNFISLFMHARRLLNAPLIDAILAGQPLWTPLGINPRLIKTAPAKRFWHAELLVHYLSYAISGHAATLTVDFESTAIIAHFIKETSKSHTKTGPRRYVTTFDLPDKGEATVTECLEETLGRLARVFITDQINEDIQRHVTNVRLSSADGQQRTYATVGEIFRAFLRGDSQKLARGHGSIQAQSVSQ